MRSLRFPLAILLLLAACKVNDTEPPAPPAPFGIEAGAEIPLGSQSIGPSGGSMTLFTSDTLRGMELTVTSGAYSDTRTFRMTYAPILSVKNDPEFHALTPLIIIENGGGYGAQPMTLKIPIALPSDQIAMAFAYTEDGRLEGLPVLDETGTTITIWTMHFDHSGVMSASSIISKGGGVRILAGARRSVIVVISEKKDKIMNMSVQSNFLPGTDDWTFPNFGSELARGGHCAGQSLGMMYYYIEHKEKGEPKLRGKFDNDDLFATPGIVFDDKSAYRYCSVLQTGYPTFLTAHINIDNMIRRLGRTKDFQDSLTFMLFKLALYKTHDPQFVGIYDAKSGHAMVVYAADASGLKVCDPNYPGRQDRRIEFMLDGFDPYNSGSDAKHLGTEFNEIQYNGVTSSLNWTMARDEWPNLLHHTVGNSAFSPFVVHVRDSASNDVVIYKDWQTHSGMAQFPVVCTSDELLVDSVIMEDGTRLKDSAWWFRIPDGRHKFGLEVWTPEDIGSASSG